MALPARYPLGEIIDEARAGATPQHLGQWQDVLQRTGGGKGLIRYQRMLALHFNRNIVFCSRYADRLKRRVEKLDDVFAEFIGRGVDKIKKLRLAIVHRLRG